ncbi:hypothetical protein [Phytohabitans aurantiacus]|uniref:Uncharacterized protein n=1 Tax=Phytohabitans aurantiacus TaxID=3016789 RepID=A0ABQ5R1I6_9ACTN|nr:hypothetical protein [Phytohabitans aurantiacus]GLI00669.1 hypothetical protein Pa4123_59450 [Phytohabitans aurantiacus]
MSGSETGLALRAAVDFIYKNVLLPAIEGLLLALNPVAGRLIIGARKKSDESLLEERLEELADTMQKSSALVTEVEAALRARQAAVEKLKTEAETARQIKDMTEQQRTAVATILRSEVARGGTKNLIQGVVVNAIFFGAGIVVTLWLG